MLGLGLTAAASCDEPRQPGIDPGASNPPRSWERRLSGYLETRDGEQLRYSVLLPGSDGRFPVIINYSGYDPGAIGGLAYQEGDTAMSASLDGFLLEHGYAVMGVNARGTGCSTGIFDFLGPEYGRDGYDIVEFAAGQPWSSGDVGMANWSWAGMSQLMTAAEQPPHLKAIAPGMVVGDMRRDSWAPGGVPAPGFITGWRGYLHERWASIRRSADNEGDTRCLQQIQENLAGEEAHSITRLVFSHPMRDEVTDARAPGRGAPRIEVPVFSMESFQDEAVTSREDYYQERLGTPKLWLLQTNGGHDLYASRAMWPVLVGFLDRFVKGEENGFDATPQVTVWMETGSTGIDYESQQELARPAWTFHLPRLTSTPSRRIEYYLDESFRLSSHAPGEADPSEPSSDEFNYPLPGPAVGTYESPGAWGPQPDGWQQGSLVYTSQALTQTLLLYGSASLDLWVSSTSADADLQATLTEVRPDGQEVFVQRGWLRLSNRALDQESSNPLRPIQVDWPSAIQPLNPDQPVFARMELNKFAHALRAGSRLRLWIDTPSPWGGYTFDYYAIPATLRLWRDARHPSVLRVGVLEGIAVPEALPPCGQVLGQPCRADPLREGARMTSR